MPISCPFCLCCESAGTYIIKDVGPPQPGASKRERKVAHKQGVGIHYIPDEALYAATSNTAPTYS